MNINTNLNCQINEDTIVCWHDFNPISVTLGGNNSLTLQFTPNSLKILEELISRLENIKTHLLAKKQQELETLLNSNSSLKPFASNGHLLPSPHSDDIPF